MISRPPHAVTNNRITHAPLNHRIALEWFDRSEAKPLTRKTADDQLVPGTSGCRKYFNECFI